MGHHFISTSWSVAKPTGRCANSASKEFLLHLQQTHRLAEIVRAAGELECRYALMPFVARSFVPFCTKIWLRSFKLNFDSLIFLIIRPISAAGP